MTSSVYRPPPGEYDKPSGKYMLVTNPAVRVDRHFVRGAVYHQGPLARYYNGAAILVELVPEPGNPHDPWAVAFHLAGQRIGYVASSYAEGFHEYIVGHNGQGRAVYAHGAVRVPPEDDVRQVTVLLPRWEEQLSFREASGVLTECDHLIESLPDDVRLRVMRASQDIAPVDVKAIRAKRVMAPDLVWSKRQGHQIPTALRYRLIDWDRSRAEQSRAVAAERRAQVVKAKSQAQAAKRKAKEELSISIAQYASDGYSITAISRMLECGEGAVRSALEIADIVVTNANEESRNARLARGRQALSLQRNGVPRKEIGAILGCGIDTVKRLLKDAKFFDEPETDVGRLERALTVSRVHHIIKVADAASALDWTNKDVKDARSDAALLDTTTIDTKVWERCTG